MDWIVFFLVMGNIIINAIVLNSNIKDRLVLNDFLKIASQMSLTYSEMAIKYNEVAAGFNETKRISDLQAEVISLILAAMLTDPALAPTALEWLTEARTKSDERLETSIDFPDVAQL
jgi:hypothetical protein